MAEETCFQNGKPCCPSLPAYIWLLSFREGIQEFSSTRSGTKRMFLVICNHLSMSFYFWRVQVFVGWLHLLKPSECSSIVLEQVTLLLEGTGTPEGKGECKLKKKKKKKPALSICKWGDRFTAVQSQGRTLLPLTFRGSPTHFLCCSCSYAAWVAPGEYLHHIYQLPDLRHPMMIPKSPKTGTACSRSIWTLWSPLPNTLCVWWSWVPPCLVYLWGPSCIASVLEIRAKLTTGVNQRSHK